MPFLEYVCKSCNKTFGELVKRHDDPVKCPVCGKEAERLWSGEMYSATGKPAKKCSGHCATCDGCK